MTPNIILVSVDSLCSDLITLELTPNLYALGEKGCHYDTTIVQTPFTVASHGSMLTGLYPFNHQLRQMVGQSLFHSAQTIFENLNEKGFTTSVLLDCKALRSDQGIFRGIQNYFDSTDVSNMRKVILEAGSRPFFAFLHYWSVHTPYLTTIPVDSWQDLYYNSKVFLGRYSNLPPSRLLPRVGSPRWQKRLESVRQLTIQGKIDTVRAGYLGAVKIMDRWIERVVQTLKEHRILEKTIIVITSDHGECFNEHGEVSIYPDGYEHGLFLFENVIRVPTIIVGPGIPAGVRISNQVESIDIVPTIYDLVGLDDCVDSGYFQLDGRSLYTNWSASQVGKQFTYSETHLRGNQKVMLRTDRYKLIEDRVDGSRKLFDLRHDPGETNNLIIQRPNLTQQMISELASFEKVSIQEKPALNRDEDPGSANSDEIEAHMRALGYL